MMNSGIEASAVNHPAGAELARHVHDRGQLSVLLRGTLEISSEEGWWVAPPGLAIWVPPNVMHGARYSESSSVLNLRFGEEFTASLPVGCDCVVVTDLLRALAFEAVRLIGSNTQTEAIELVVRLMVLQIRQPQQGPGLFLPHGRDRRLRQATSLLRADPASNVPLDELATRVHTSARTLARLFVNETGMPFTRWREHLRVICAVEYLARGQSIIQTALALGYKNTSSFTTLFTRLVGSPPRRYMDQLRQRQTDT
ncbi:AraC family transcriptional regulator [Paraburkholderia caribensis]|uniref:AraC family transcriptional regulator n=1 Tax=Paraburkholderia caribensis TaxID=75105 RepID=UPI001D065EDA|nr:helix-turn-helix transcriptional regulator [Paraburkholderia caribensis]